MSIDDQALKLSPQTDYRFTPNITKRSKTTRLVMRNRDMDCSFISTEDLRRVFEKLDKNQDGLVTLDELHWILERLGWSEHTPQELELIVGKQSLNLDEFLRFYYDDVSNSKGTNNMNNVDDEAIVRAFNVFDVNGDGYISSEELRTVLERLGFEEEAKTRDCGRMIRVHDKNLDGVIDFQEFKNMMLHVVQ